MNWGNFLSALSNGTGFDAPEQHGRILARRFVPAKPAAVDTQHNYSRPERMVRIVRRNDAVLAAIEAQPGIDMPGIREVTGLQGNSIYSALTELLHQSRVRREGQRGEYRYFATGKQLAPRVQLSIRETTR